MEADKGESFICYKCGYTAHTKRTLIKHIKSGNCNLKTDIKKASITANFYVCTQCSEEFDKKSNLNSHIVKKHPEIISSLSCKVYECKTCDYKTLSKCNFSRHILIHQDASNYKLSCPHCNATFKQRIALEDHIVKKHPEFVKSIKRSIYECPNCPYKTVIKHRIDEHVMIHSDAVPMHKCIHCKAAFRRRRTLEDHIVIKHPEVKSSVTRKIYQCPYCSYRTLDTNKFQTHLLKHPGAVSSIKCEYCNAVFQKNTSLGDHTIQKHPEHITAVTCKIHHCPDPTLWDCENTGKKD
ncbi:unnamed protein product [Acanthoscelides obtectus]|uniref:C2H2-type domain-containing protein n=1 Tax=Acanthoscelides obtectus TaxID=200917 RepID=A0A9P0KQK7_ACAOB|nr:unnamed protein product [Acanthoscelides obtectus]CAK1675759.1 Zinc finger protein 711 [Acanthoscelides obtectus]